MLADFGMEDEWTDENANDSSSAADQSPSPVKKKRLNKVKAKPDKAAPKGRVKKKGQEAKDNENDGEDGDMFGDTAFHDLKDLEQTLEAVAASYFGAVSVTKSNKVKNSEKPKKKKGQEGAVSVPLEALRDWLQIADSKLCAPAQEHYKKLKANFDKWCLQLAMGFNVLLYGFGSKKKLLDEFCTDMLAKQSFTYVKMDAFKPAFDLKAMLISLFESLKLTAPQDTSVSNLVESLAKYYSTDDDSLPELVFVLNNIDGVALRSNVMQSALANLASIKQIHMIASVDHPNLPILWDSYMTAKFNWAWHEATTFHCYKEELSSGDSKMLGLSSSSAVGGHTLASLESVWASLTKNARRIFVVLTEEVFKLIEANMKKKGNSRLTVIGVDYWKVYKKCHSEFLVSNETNFERQLVEFIDHRLITKKNVDSSDMLNLSVDLRVLQSFMGEQGIELISLNLEDDNLVDLENALDELSD